MDKEEWEITKDAPLEQKERQHFWMSHASGAGILSLDCISGKLELTSEEEPHSTHRSLKPIPPGRFWQTSDFHFLSEIYCLLGQSQETWEPPRTNVDLKETS